jgi:hypothetical protein
LDRARELYPERLWYSALPAPFLVSGQAPASHQALFVRRPTKQSRPPFAVKDNRFFIYVSLLLFVVCEGWKLLLRISWTHRGNARFPRINYSDLGHMAVRFVIPSSLVSTARFRGFKIEILAERFDIVSALLVKDESRRPFDTN